MSLQPKTWTGSASFSLISGAANVVANTTVTTHMDPTTIPVVWASGAPVGRQSDYLSSTFVGYQVSYDVQYVLGGWIYDDVSVQPALTEHTTDFFTGVVAPPNTLIPIKGSGLWWYWRYGTVDGNSTYVVPNGGVIPSRIDYNFFSPSPLHVPHDVTWNIYYTITVTQNCGNQGNINSPVCQDICVASLSTECFTNYSQYCLNPTGDASLLAGDTCVNFFVPWIDKNGSTPQIDAQARRYCSSKYEGFSDLLNGSKTVPDSERLKDIPICACNLVDKQVSDPIGSVLYQNYWNSLVMQFPFFKTFGASIQQKCLVPSCASATFKPAGVGPGGCKVPQCINAVTINNNGTINGNVSVDTSCSGGGNDPANLSIATVIIIVLAVLLVIFAIVYFFTTPGDHRFKSKRDVITSGQASPGAIMQQLAS